ncbi:type II toxin-antitoxin system Phd/YefM family antitoxin [Fusibacter sp. 3D3]|uniref:type II toxin-antitoxin system Phd/YefM family antitoxin n=1 Tax=Fusibacter sp. 3D3 TaxID=1048380 RepID=UPI0008532C3F|nr:type II toxin-antitoxin system Phd/YefM family antitoxin [Fusibacter sp. 3D3]GAU75633.1 YefM protein [Fusibacter sp. 3D3]
MLSVTAKSITEVRDHLKECIDDVNDNFEAIIVQRSGRGKNGVLISENAYNNMMENMHVRRNPDSYSRLSTSIKQHKEGLTHEKELVNE